MPVQQMNESKLSKPSKPSKVSKLSKLFKHLSYLSCLNYLSFQAYNSSKMVSPCSSWCLTRVAKQETIPEPFAQINTPRGR